MRGLYERRYDSMRPYPRYMVRFSSMRTGNGILSSVITSRVNEVCWNDISTMRVLFDSNILRCRYNCTRWSLQGIHQRWRRNTRTRNELSPIRSQRVVVFPFSEGRRKSGASSPGLTGERFTVRPSGYLLLRIQLTLFKRSEMNVHVARPGDASWKPVIQYGKASDGICSHIDTEDSPSSINEGLVVTLCLCLLQNSEAHGCMIATRLIRDKYIV